MFVYIIYSKDKEYIFEIYFDEQDCIDNFNDYYNSDKCNWKAVSFERILEVL